MGCGPSVGLSAEASNSEADTAAAAVHVAPEYHGTAAGADEEKGVAGLAQELPAPRDSLTPRSIHVETEAPRTLFDRLGGDAELEGIVETLYRKVEKDSVLLPFFEGIDMDRLRSHQVAFLRMTFDGPNLHARYNCESMALAHMHLIRDKGLGQRHFDVMLRLLVESLVQQRVPQELVDEAVAVVGPLRQAFAPVAAASIPGLLNPGLDGVDEAVGAALPAAAAGVGWGPGVVDAGGEGVGSGRAWSASAGPGTPEPRGVEAGVSAGRGRSPSPARQSGDVGVPELPGVGAAEGMESGGVALPTTASAGLGAPEPEADASGGLQSGSCGSLGGADAVGVGPGGLEPSGLKPGGMWSGSAESGGAGAVCDAVV